MENKDRAIGVTHLLAEAVEFLQKVDLDLLKEVLKDQALGFLKLQLLVSELADYCNEPVPETEPDGFFRVTWSYRDGVLKITIPGHLPRLDYYDYRNWRVVNHSIVSRLRRGLKGLPEDIKFAKAYCVFKMCYKLRHNWDVQNRAYQAVLNAIAAEKILPDDNVNHVATVLLGRQVEDASEERSEVYLIPFGEVEKLVAVLQEA